MAGENPGRSVSEAEARNVEAGNSSEVSGLSLVDLRIFLGAVNKSELFLQRHLAQKLIDARIAGDGGDRLRERVSGSDRDEQD